MTDPPDQPANPLSPANDPAQLARLADAVRALDHPRQIGPYRIVALIGEGGMGAVYQAEQEAPLRRTVAIKIIRPGMDTREVIARFEAERQALALMNHANVARVIDAGATELGRPYFVMEYVAGESITRFADRERLTIADRLRLLMQACDGAQHAHQKGVIHRDLKPSNILVSVIDGKPVVKIIDFGVSKAIDQRMTAKTFFTEAGQFLGTLEYMSPEQADARGDDIDTRTDIYSLGVVLYELLTGSVPFDAATLRTAGFAEIQRIIREEDPPRPSTKLSKLGTRVDAVVSGRQMTLQTLERQLQRELDWIPLKALRKDRGQRYASAAELAEDIGNYLAARPLRAGPESGGYRLRKFARRNRGKVLGALAVLTVLSAGAATTAWQAIAARRAQRRAEDVSENLNQVNRFLIEDILASASPEITRGRDLTVRDALDRSAGNVARRFTNLPQSRADVELVLARTYDAIGVSELALIHARNARESTDKIYGANDAKTMRASLEIGRDLCHLNRPGEAEPLLRDVYDRARKNLGDAHPITLDALSNLAMAVRMQDRLDEADALYRRALTEELASRGTESVEASDAMNNLAVNLATQGRQAEAASLFRKSVDIKRRQYGSDHPAYLGSLANLSKALQAEGKIDDAEQLGREALDGLRRVLKDDHPSTLLAMNDVAYLLIEEGKLDEGEALHREAMQRRARALGADDPDTLQSMQNLAHVLALKGEFAQAEAMERDVLTRRSRVLGPKAFGTINTTNALARVLFEKGDYAECASLMQTVCRAGAFGVYSPAEQAINMARWGVALARIGDFASAEPVLIDALTGLGRFPPPNAKPMRDVLQSLADACEHGGRNADATIWRNKLADMSVATQPTTPTPLPRGTH